VGTSTGLPSHEQPTTGPAERTPYCASASTAMPLKGIIQSEEHTSAPNASGLKAAAQQAGKGKASQEGVSRKQKEREDGREVEKERGAAGFYVTCSDFAPY
jgi:hypothetical protein